MRFAYIDSNGNEVPIPSVDALALRIELGAITDDTQLYDAAADQWGPAHTHEIYHTLARSAGEDDQFVAPPPVSPPVAPPSPPTADSAGAVDAGATEVEPAQAPTGPAAEVEAEPETGPEDAPDDGGVSELTLAEPIELEEGADDLRTVDGEAEDDLDFELAPAPDAGSADGPADGGVGALDLAPPMDSVEDAEGEATLDLDAGGDDDAGFDFGDGPLELDGGFDEPADDEALDFSGGLGAEGFDTGAPDLGAGGDFGMDDAAGGVGDEAGLETAMEFDPGGFDVGDGGSLDLEAPMSDFSPEDPPGWMEPDAGEDGDVLDFSSVAAGDGDPAGDPGPRERRTPRNRPSPPKHRKQRNPMPLVLAVLVIAIGLGGYAAWPTVSARLAAGGNDDDGQVRIPVISAELMPQMRSVAEAALSATFEDVVAGWQRPDRVGAPPTDWLGGAYLANASAYEEVETFWTGMSDLLGEARGISLVDFDAAVEAELAAQGITGDDATAIRERADSGFVAASPQRMAVYDRFAALIDASLRLHEFLLANEAGLEHVPASSATTNPVLEVDAATPELSSAMDGMLDDVTSALRDMGYRDAVTSRGLRDHVSGQIRQQGIQ